MITHVPMAVHPNIKKVLVIGIGDGGVVRELTRYDQIKRIDLVEMDEMAWCAACLFLVPAFCYVYSKIKKHEYVSPLKAED